MIKKKCSNIMCNEMIPRTQQPPYCNDHIQQRHKQYDQTKRNKKHKAFYNSAQWERFRKTVLAEHHYLCSVCGDNGNVVHHIVEIADDWGKRFERDNCTVVCSTCHNKLHKKNNFVFS